MASVENVVAKMPLWFIFFIPTLGLFVTLSFPFDILKANFESGIVLSNMTNMSLVNVFKSLDQDFKPFVMLQYLGNSFPSGLTEIVLLSLVVGFLVYLLVPVYEWTNGRLMKGYCFLCRKEYNRSDKLPKENLSAGQIRPFVEWSTAVNWGYIDFNASLNSMMVGLLFGAETFLLFNFIRIVDHLALAFAGQIEWSWIGLEPAYWFIASVVLGFLCHQLLREFRTRFNDSFNSSVKTFKKAYKAERPKPSEKPTKQNSVLPE